MASDRVHARGRARGHNLEHFKYLHSFICKFFKNLNLDIQGSESFDPWTKDTLEDPIQCLGGETKVKILYNFEK